MGMDVRAVRDLLPGLFTLLLIACHGDTGTSTGTSAAQLTAQEFNSPHATGDIASDGLSWINYRRAQAGLAPLQRDPRIDHAAAAHANYQQLNNLVTHDEDQSRPGFTGLTAADRLRAFAYPLDTESRADGEIIAATTEPDGFAAADGLMGAIYHRYLMLEPRFDLAGSGSAHRAGGYYWLNVNLVATPNSAALGAGRIVVWPAPDQEHVRTSFLSDEETPDPVAGRNKVGYPVSVHADSGTRLQVSRFVIRERGGTEIDVKLLEHGLDGETPASAVAIIPLSVLRKGIVYDVEFIGRLDDVAVMRSWSFTTQ
jgi:uncharacterized protein YkwD